jgi:hypothetical protein
MRLTNVWAFAVSACLLCGATAISFSLANGGLGLVREDGTYRLRQGRTEREVNQTFGAIFYGVGLLAAALAAVTVTLSVVVFLNEGTLKAAMLIRGRTPPEARVLRVLRISQIYAAVAVVLSFAYWLLGS